ncbi:ferritin-like domain-containing protein [Patescibacteria group bacterium]|nr:ferritin-like domain-containing protein [Patescibacteria group bacterium]MBU1124221.1 ferritin-like domain-containing protein [Patescibacteria group bacterium]MBU1911214.1 ferritin-like domain-containing protein [Patescibacteria group bacterium]
MITKEELIRELNGDLAYEFAAAIQYVQHVATLTGGEFQSINAELIVHVNEEIGHANILAEQIDYLGGIPTMDVAERFTDKDSRKMLEQDLEGERLAIRRYRERVKQAQELELYALETALKQILADEEEHERDIMEALGM